MKRRRCASKTQHGPHTWRGLNTRGDPYECRGFTSQDAPCVCGEPLKAHSNPYMACDAGRFTPTNRDPLSVESEPYSMLEDLKRRMKE